MLPHPHQTFLRFFIYTISTTLLACDIVVHNATTIVIYLLQDTLQTATQRRASQSKKWKAGLDPTICLATIKKENSKF